MKATPSFLAMTRHFLAQEFAARERVVTPIMFGAIVILMFAFTLPQPPAEWRIQILVAEALISSFFVLQLSLSRAFEVESQDRVFDMIRVSPISGSSFICAKLVQVTILSGSALVFTATMATVAQGITNDNLTHPLVLALGLLMVIGLAALGTLLSAVTLRAEAKQVLFPILYFPLSTPVLLAASEFLCRFLADPVFDESNRGWFIMLAAFDAIYLTLAVLMGAEAVSEG